MKKVLQDFKSPENRYFYLSHVFCSLFCSKELSEGGRDVVWFVYRAGFSNLPSFSVFATFNLLSVVVSPSALVQRSAFGPK